ncbi:MAG: DUF433 domain-containing protein [Blastocatellia bacterium]
MAKDYIEQKDGVYKIIGSRVSLDSVIYQFLDGFSPETIATECFPTLSLEQVYGAISFYLANRSEVDKYLAEQRKEYEAKRQAAIEQDPTFYQRMRQIRNQQQVTS